MPIDLEQQRKRAKDLVKTHARGDTDAIARVTAQLPDAIGPLTLARAQLVVAREAGHGSWPRLKQAAQPVDLDALLDALLDAAIAGEPRTEPTTTLHLAAARGEPLERFTAPVDERAGRRAWTPLLYTCCARLGREDPAQRIANARALLAAGADVDATGPEVDVVSEHVDGFDVEAWSPLAGAAGRVGSAALLRVLLDAGARVDGAPALLEHAVWSGNLEILEVALAAKPPWWQVIWALVACADLDRPAQARMLVPHAVSPKSLEPALVRALREERALALFEILLGDATPSPQRRALEDTAYRAARRYHQEAAAALLRRRGASETVLSVADRAIAGERITTALRDDDHRMLSWAIAHGHVERVPHLLAIGCDPNVHDEAGLLPLHHAANMPAVIAQLVAAGARADAMTFDEAAELASPATFAAAVTAVVDGDLAALQALLDDDPALVHARSPRPHRCTLLHYTAANGTEVQRSPANAGAVAALLLARGADPNASCRLYGGGQAVLGLMLTSVHPRAAQVDGDLVRAYATHGARIDDDAIEIAVQYNSPRALAALVEAGAPVTLLVAAALGDDALVAQHLATTDVDHRYGDGYTALHAAASAGHRSTALLLLARGADPTLEDTRWGGTAADKARHFGHTALAAELDAG